MEDVSPGIPTARYPAISGLHRAGASIRRVDVSCQISEKVVAFRPAGETASRNTLQSCKGRWDLRDIPQRHRLPVIQVHILDDSLSRINATFPAGDVSLPTCSATLSIPRERRPKKIGLRKYLSSHSPFLPLSLSLLLDASLFSTIEGGNLTQLLIYLAALSKLSLFPSQ